MHMLQTIEQRRKKIAGETPAKRKSELGQFMTPSGIARYMASMFSSVAARDVRLLDAGAGIGSLTAAFAEMALAEKVHSLDVETWEIDPNLHDPLTETLEGYSEMFGKADTPFAFTVRKTDFVEAVAAYVAAGDAPSFTHAILNPPYKKIHSASVHRKALRAAGVETGNLYSAFVALALLSLANDGELVAITPRSFCNGPYFKSFRKLVLDKSALLRIHVFESRDHAFKGDEVLQENVIFHLAKGRPQGNVVVSSSVDASFSGLTERIVPIGEVVMNDDPQMIFHLVAEGDDSTVEAGMRAYTRTLEELGIGVATGPVVDFRLRPHLRQEVEKGCVPLIYPLHFSDGFVSHPKTDSRKPNGIADNDETSKWLMPSGHYVVVRRLSSKEEKRRIVPAIFDPARVPGKKVGFENHLNVFHVGRKGMTSYLSKGLAVFLGSTLADKWLRRFSGHTQVNAGDLHVLRYPDLETLSEWGSKVGDALPSQQKIDEIVEGGMNVVQD